MIKYISTRGGDEPQSFEQVLLSGLAPDGGLYVPQTWPQIDYQALKGKSYNDIAEAVMYPYVEGCIPRENFRRIIDETYNENIFHHPDITPVKPLYEATEGEAAISILELFHGPTIAFKDIALQLLGRLFDYVLEKKNERVTIIGATSGDTGSAAIEGCRHSKHADIFILHPYGRVSDVQRRQMTTVDAPNVHNIAVKGTFDNCQALVKAMFNNSEFREENNLCAVNSINWARIMAQIVYYFTAALAAGVPDKNVSFVVPTGNFGNVFAAYCARKMGLPIKTLAIATNRNDILTRFFETGRMETSEVTPTLSPSMDIQISSNFERYLFDVYERDHKKLAEAMAQFSKNGKLDLNRNNCDDFLAFRANDEETLHTIRTVYENTGYILDPHSAVGVHAAFGLKTELAKKSQDNDIIISLGCAHAAKFPQAIEKSVRLHPDLPSHLRGLLDRKEHYTVLNNSLGEVKIFIKGKKTA